MLQNALDKVNELIALDMGSLVEDKGRREKVRPVPLSAAEVCAHPHPLSVNGLRRKYSSGWSPFAISTCVPRLLGLL